MDGYRFGVPTHAERREVTRAALVDAARPLFAEHGFAATSTEDILAAAGLSRGAMYHHFRSKEHLFEAVYEAVEADLTQRVVEQSIKGRDAMHQLRLGVDAFLDHCLDPDVQRIVLLDGPTVLSWETWREIDERYAYGLIKAALDEAVRAGLITRQPTEPLTHVLLGAMIQAGMVVARAEDPAVAKRQMSRTFKRMLAAL